MRSWSILDVFFRQGLNDATAMGSKLMLVIDCCRSRAANARCSPSKGGLNYLFPSMTSRVNQAISLRIIHIPLATGISAGLSDSRPLQSHRGTATRWSWHIRRSVRQSDLAARGRPRVLSRLFPIIRLLKFVLHADASACRPPCPRSIPRIADRFSGLRHICFKCFERNGWFVVLQQLRHLAIVIVL